jgi:hypothetical protein
MKKSGKTDECEDLRGSIPTHLTTLFYFTYQYFHPIKYFLNTFNPLKLIFMVAWG